MGQNRPSLRRFAWLAGLSALIILASLALLSSAGAQETPGAPTPVPTASTPSAQETPSPGQTPGADETVVRLEIVASDDPMPQGKEFQVRVLLDNVDHLASYGLTLAYDSERVEPLEAPAGQDGTAEPTAEPDATEPAGGTGQPTNEPDATEAADDATQAPEEDLTSVKASDLGDILASSPRSDGVFCFQPFARGSEVQLNCVTRLLPVCAGGPAGAAGSGTLGTISFKGIGGGLAVFRIIDTPGTLVLDDLDNCEVVEVDGELMLEGETVPIAHTVGPPVSIEIKSSGGFSGVLIGVIVAVVVVVAAAGGAGYLWYRRRGAA